jgi:hypothetical protein
MMFVSLATPNLPGFGSFCQFKLGIPSRDTFSEVVARLDSMQFLRCVAIVDQKHRRFA